MGEQAKRQLISIQSVSKAKNIRIVPLYYDTLTISNNYIPDDILNGEPLPSILDILPTILLKYQTALQKYGKSKHSNCGVYSKPPSKCIVLVPMVYRLN